MKECYIDDTAGRFQACGIAALVYDHRGWGSSEGSPWQETNPAQQAEDYHDAVSFVRESLVPAIDPGRIAIWGIGHSGGAAIMAAGDDPRIRAAIFNMPFASGRADALAFPPGYLDEALREREVRPSLPNHAREYIPVWDDSLEQARSTIGISSSGRAPWLHGESMYQFITNGIARSTSAGTPWENRLTLSSLYHIWRSEPQDHIHKVAVPYLYLVAATDALTGTPENHRMVFNRDLSGLGRFVQVGDTHLGNYFEKWEESVGLQVAFLREVL